MHRLGEVRCEKGDKERSGCAMMKGFNKGNQWAHEKGIYIPDPRLGRLLAMPMALPDSEVSRDRFSPLL